ncbi:sulfatase [Candidatus Vecturithrix granuli]|uniref:Sulfatase n=1 Tax=Vecturithrix granuli TaxID=1499967 RepID=A0A081BY61_VECG1|nr:sulfatase [Candidatus Vecturithrix granuli]
MIRFRFISEFLFVDALIVFLLMLGDFFLRTSLYLDKITHLFYGSGWIKIIGVYGLVILITASLLFVVRKLPGIGIYLVLIILAGMLTSNLLWYSVTHDFLETSYVQVVLNSDIHAVYGAIKSYCSSTTLTYFFTALGIVSGIGVIYRKTQKKYSLCPWGLLTVCVIGSVSSNYYLWNYLYFKLHDFPVEPISNSIRTAIFTVKEYREFYGIQRQALSENFSSQIPNHHIVLIIDESVRYDYLSNNNSRLATTPFLKELEANPQFYNLGLSIAASTCSFPTKSLILTGTTEIPDVTRQTQRRPTLFQYAKRSGYETTILDAPGSNFPNIVIRKEDLRYVDHLLRADDIPGTHHFVDQRAAETLQNFLEKPVGQFIVLVKQGAHFHYESSYPRTVAQFSRHLPRLEVNEGYGSSKEKTINSYKNALSFTVDEFARTLFSRDFTNTTIIWTSDHGQSLQEQGQTYTHCKSEIEQAIVPLFIYSDHEWVKFLQPSLGKPEGIITSHHHLYPTIISLITGDQNFVNNGYHSLFSTKVKQQPLSYLYGGIWNLSHVIELLPYDVERFFPIVPNTTLN